jgi:hypothetical protein
MGAHGSRLQDELLPFEAGRYRRRRLNYKARHFSRFVV